MQGGRGVGGWVGTACVHDGVAGTFKEAGQAHGGREQSSKVQEERQDGAFFGTAACLEICSAAVFLKQLLQKFHTACSRSTQVYEPISKLTAPVKYKLGTTRHPCRVERHRGMGQKRG